MAKSARKVRCSARRAQRGLHWLTEIEPDFRLVAYLTRKKPLNENRREDTPEQVRPQDLPTSTF